MYDIRQFKPSLYVLLIIGMTGFSLAAESPITWLLSIGTILFNAWLVRTNRFIPMPRLLANGVTILAMLYVGNDVLHSPGPPILVIGQFLVLLQLIKLFEQRGNRDYAQLLILSLLLMVAASINTASLAFAVLLISYLFLSLYCCLLFHLKVETDAARQAIAVPEQERNPAALRQDQRYLSRSMRQLTLIVSVVSVAMAVLVFLSFPRHIGASLLGPLQFRAAQTLTGFTDSVKFDTVTKITQNTQVVAHVRLWHNDEPILGTTTLLLRGVALDVYRSSADAENPTLFQWSRSDLLAMSDSEKEPRANFALPLTTNPGSERWRQEITLQPTNTTVLFAMPGIVTFRPSRAMRIKYYPEDQSLQIGELSAQPINYEVVSSNQLVASESPDYTGLGGALDQKSTIDPQIEAFARRPEVSGTDAQGSLAARRKPIDGTRGDASLDPEIAANIEQYLRSNFSYSLDLTGAPHREGDPLVAFLYDLKRGHCEYFAGAMALMCQSLGMKARVVVGFKCDEYNNTPGADYYIVRQSHAHAWCEVLMPDKSWRTFDPTSARDADASGEQSLWTRARHLFDFLEFTWATSVVAYDHDSRENLMQQVETQLAESTSGLSKWQRKLRNIESWHMPEHLQTWLIGLMILGVLGTAGWFMWERWRLRKRAARIGLDALPSADQVRLVRQLGFYDDLLRLLERHGIKRPRHLTPMEFSDTLSYLPNEAFDSVQRLTSVFYRVRFGRAELSSAKRQKLNLVIDRLEEVLHARPHRT